MLIINFLCCRFLRGEKCWTKVLQFKDDISIHIKFKAKVKFVCRPQSLIATSKPSKQVKTFTIYGMSSKIKVIQIMYRFALKLNTVKLGYN